MAARHSSTAAQPRRVNRRLEVDLDELQVMQCLEDVTLIDVRQPAELSSQDQIPGSVNIPLGHIKEAFHLSPSEWQARFSFAKPVKTDKAIVFYARGPNASSAAVEIAHTLGYTKARHYPGGWEEYCRQQNLSLFKPEQREQESNLPAPFYNFYDPQLYYYR